MCANAKRDGRPAEYRVTPSGQRHKVWLTCTTRVPYSNQGCSLQTLVLVSRHLKDMKNGLGLGLEIKVLVLVLVLTKKSRYFQDLDE